jgi:hypothetical protein
MAGARNGLANSPYDAKGIGLICRQAEITLSDQENDYDDQQDQSGCTTADPDKSTHHWN